MLPKFVAGAAGQRGMSCAARAFLATAVIAPSMFVAVTAVTFTSAQAQQATSTPLPPIPVETKKKKKVTRHSAEPAPRIRQEVDVQPEADAEPARQTNDAASMVRSGPGVSTVNARTGADH
jgi:hypothetical protein